MGKLKENEKHDWDLRLYLRLLGYVKPYWKQLAAGIFAGLIVGGSLFFSLLMIPQMAGVVDPVRPGAAEQETRQSVQTAKATEDIRLNKMLEQADSYARKYNLPFEVKGREIILDWPAKTSFEVVGADGRMAWQLFCIYAAGFVLAWVFKNLADYVNRYCMRAVSAKVVRDMRNEIFRRLMGQSLKFYGSRDVGELISRSMNDTSMIENSVSESVADLTSCPLQVLACLAAIFVACRDADNYALIIILVCGMPLLLIPMTVLSRKIRHIYRRSCARIADVTSRMHEVFTGIRVIKAYHTETQEQEVFEQVNFRYYREIVRSIKYQLLISPSMEIITVTATLVFLVFSYSRGVQLSQLAALLSPAILAYKPMKEISKVMNHIQRSLAAADRYFEIIDTHEELPEKANAAELTEFKDRISLKNVTFGYGDRKILDNISFDIPRGSMVAVVGETGSGKTTIANLLARFYDASSGAVTIDGVDVRDYSISSLRRHIGVVTQDAVLFNDTIAHNIAYGCPDASREDIISAARQANAHSFIVDGRHVQGYDTEVGEKGFRLSGGEKQRVSIARAILKNPPILILDEATSALDTVTEKLVQEALTRVMANRTVFSIAHRLSTIRNADMILVLKQGHIAECGTHDELLANADGIYRKLYRTQFELDA